MGKMHCLLTALAMAATLAPVGVHTQGQQAPAPGPQGQAPGGAQPPRPMGFFVTSVGIGKGGDLGGLAGADAHCQALAAAVGAGGRTWRAYLSTAASGNQPAVNARDRIGKGPWANAKGVIVARDLAHLHGDTLELAQRGNNLTRQTALNEKGGDIKGPESTPDEHAILTGSTLGGLAYAGQEGMDRTCNNWTSSGAGTGAPVHGHHDRTGNSSWVSAHPQPQSGCSQADLVERGGVGLFYCFAAD